MADYSELKAAIRAAIYDNVTQAITGAKLQQILLEIVDEMELGDASEFFWAIYGVTTFAQVSAARAAGKVCVVAYDGGVFVLGRSVGESTGDPVTEYFFTSIEANASKRVSLKNTDAWSYSVFYLELTYNKAQSMTGNEASTTKYPSTKCIANLAETWTFTLADGTTVTKKVLVLP